VQHVAGGRLLLNHPALQRDLAEEPRQPAFREPEPGLGVEEVGELVDRKQIAERL